MGPLQLAVHDLVVQNRQSGEQKSRALGQDKQ